MTKEIRFDLHAHANLADGKNTVEEMIASARKKGLDYFAITEHNRSLSTPQNIIDENGRTTILPGVEISTINGHVLLIGVEPKKANSILEKLDILDKNPNLLVGYRTLKKALIEFHNERALSIAPHPFLLFFSPIAILSFTPERIIELFDNDLIQGAEENNSNIRSRLQKIGLRPIYKL